MNKNLKIILIAILLLSITFVLLGCSNECVVTLDYDYTYTATGIMVPYKDARRNSPTDTVSVKRNDTYCPPRASDRPGYTFQGWYKDTALTQPWVNGEDKVKSDITLYAKWEANED